MSTSIIFIALFSGLAGSLITQLYANYSYAKQERKRQKVDILKQLMANRTALTQNYSPEEEYKFFEALNSIFAIFHENKKVINAVEKFHSNPNNAADNTYNLIKEICIDLGIDTSNFDKSVFEKPLIRRK